jgi:hypothetical protein
VPEAARVSLGYWRYKAKFDRLRSESAENASRDDNAGAYVIVEASALTTVSANVSLSLALVLPAPASTLWAGTWAAVPCARGTADDRKHPLGVATAVAELVEWSARLVWLGNVTSSR